MIFNSEINVSFRISQFFFGNNVIFFFGSFFGDFEKIRDFFIIT